MSLSKTLGPALAGAAMLVGLTALGGVASAAPLSSAVRAADPAPAPGMLPIRHARWGGVGIYIGPGYGFYPGYGYYDGYYDDYYYPRRSTYYYDGYDRPYRRHGHRWVRERFEHPLGRR